MTSANNSTVKKWEKKVLLDTYKKTIFARMISEGAIKDAPEITGRNRGDRTRISFVEKLTGLGTLEGGTLQGNEEALATDTHILAIGLLRHGVNNPNDDTIEQNRTFIDFMKSTTEVLTPWHGTRMDASFLQQLAGAYPTSIAIEGATYTGTNRAAVTGFNDITAPTTNRILRAGGAATDQALTSSDTMTVDLIDDALVRIKQSTPTFDPLPNGRFMLVLAPQQVLDLQRDSAGDIQMLRDIIVPKTEGSGSSSLQEQGNFGMFNMPVMRYRNVDIYESPNVALGVNSGTSASISTVRRGVLLGQNAGVFGSKFGTLRGGNSAVKLYTQLTDYDYYKGLEARVIYGMNKIVLQNEDYGVFVLPTYAAI